MIKQQIQECLRQQQELRHSINKESYYYTETISTKHRTSFLGINAHPYYTYHTERRFNQERYDQDTAVANARINNLETQIKSLRQQEAAEEQARQHAVAVEQARQRAIAKEKARLEAIEQEKQQKIADEQARLDAVKYGNDVISSNISKQQKANFDMLQSLNSKQRAFFLSELFGKSDSESMTMISIIKSLGVDADELAYYAIKKTHNELFELALHYGANCCNYQIEGTTLLQQLVHSGNESFIKKVLAKGQDLTCTLVEAIGQNDVVTISKLSSYDSSLLSQKFVGYTLLQTAISAQKAQMVQKILQLDNSSAEVLTNNGESALKIAVRSGNDEIIKMVAQHANLQIEIAQLGPKVEQALKDKILEYQDIETVIKLLRCEEMSLQQYLLTKQNHSRTTEEGVVTVGEEARLETMKQTKQQKQDCDDEQLVNSTSLQGVIHIESLESQFDEIHLIGNNNAD